jgi:hypothetical protein
MCSNPDGTTERGRIGLSRLLTFSTPFVYLIGLLHGRCVLYYTARAVFICSYGLPRSAWSSRGSQRELPVS